MSIIITVLILVLMLGILVSAHEAGHLIVAKAFNVYCLEYSIGFGPKVFSVKKKNGETYFSLRWFPLGGYVSMYGEGVELPRGVSIPESRSLEGVAKWKRALILIAGIAVNFALSVVLILIYAVAFPSIQQYDLVTVDSETVGVGYSLTVESSSVAASSGLSGSDIVFSQGGVDDAAGTFMGYLIDSEVDLNGGKYVALFDPTTAENPDFVSGLTFYEATYTTDSATNVKTYVKASATAQAKGIVYLPNSTFAKYKFLGGDDVSVDLTVFAKDAEGSIVYDASFPKKTVPLKAGSDGSLSSIGLTMATTRVWGSFLSRLAYGFQLWGRAFMAIFQAIGLLFTGNTASLGGVVAMGSGINSAIQFMGVGRTFFLDGGFISINLAIFNFLPFPGLDGWGLLVTAIEGISRKKVPTKFKNIVSMVGLALLFVVAILITIRDIANLV